MISDPVPKHTKLLVAQLAEDVLERAGVLGEIPTPLDPVRAAAGVREVVDISELPADLEAKKPSRMRRILGALWFREKVVFLDRQDMPNRQRFTDAHEASHSMCAWHETIVRLDDVASLRGDLKEQIENEANFGASQLLFQGTHFHRRALLEQVSIRTPLALAGYYGASRHAALHYYTEEHPDEVALLVAGRLRNFDGTVPVWQSIESESFRERFGRLVDLLPKHQLKVVEGQDAPLAGICEQSKTSLDPPAAKISLPDQGGKRHPFVAEAFFNQYCQFVFVAAERARRLGRRARLAEFEPRERVRVPSH
jgi:IrrE N-terminal-like domain